MLLLIIILDFSCTVTFPEKNSLHSFNLTPYAAETGEGEEVEKQGNCRTYEQLNHHTELPILFIVVIWTIYQLSKFAGAYQFLILFFSETSSIHSLTLQHL